MSDRYAPARVRPVADAPVAVLVAAAQHLAKRWLMALIAAAPLERASRLPMDALAREAPALCAQAVRALASDRELERLIPGGDLFGLARRAGLLAAADDPGSSVAAVEALRAVLWVALLEELRDPTTAQVGELSSRLAHVCAAIATAAASVESGSVGAAGPVGAASCSSDVPGAGAGPFSSSAPAASGVRVASDAPCASAETLAPDPPYAWDAPHPQAPSPEVALAAVAPPSAWRDDLDGVPAEGPAAWISSIGRRLERYADDGRPFAVLLIEVADVERLRHAESGDELARLVGEVERALSGELRPADVLTREAVGRYWLVTPETDRPGSKTLAERLARAVSAAASHRGVPLQVAIGASVCPDDGLQPAALAAHADMGVYAARASGRTTAPA
jgi:GGDEF domain-containing protein